jgi:hypothetical protein
MKQPIILLFYHWTRYYEKIWQNTTIFLSITCSEMYDSFTIRIWPITRFTFALRYDSIRNSNKHYAYPFSQEIPVNYNGSQLFVDPISMTLQPNATHIPCSEVRKACKMPCAILHRLANLRDMMPWSIVPVSSMYTTNMSKIIVQIRIQVKTVYFQIP